MTEFEWSDELAIGIDSVDAEHRQLIALVGRAEAARLDGNIRAAARLLRQFVSEFNRHFDKELGLLSGLTPDQLARRRSEHQTSQAVVHAHPLGADDVQLIERLTSYARAWLTDHIVRQDLPCRHAFWGKRADSTRRNRFSRRLDFIKLRWRIALLAAIPLLALVGLTTVAVIELCQQSRSMQLLRQLNDLNGQVGRLVHELQRERGMATMFSAGRREHPELLQAQMALTDEAHGRFDLAAAELLPKLPEGPAKQIIDNAVVALDTVPEIRSDIVSGSFDGVETIEIYTTAIDDLDAVVPVVVRAILPSNFATDTQAYMFLLELKERAGRERAAGVAMLGGGARGHSTKTLQELVTEQEAFAGGFLQLAPADLAHEFRAADVADPMFIGLRRRMAVGETSGIRVEEWSAAAAARIERINEVQTHLIARLADEAGSLQQAAEHRAVLLGAAFGALLVVSLGMVAALGWSILPPLRRIGTAIQRLSQGVRALDVPDREADDELGDIARSVQSLKERLVQGDLLEARRWTENAERLRAVTDNLPGVVFRIDQSNGRSPIISCVSRKLREITGLPPADVVDMPLRTLLRRLLRTEDWPVVLTALHRAGERPLDFEFRLRDSHHGRPRWMRVLASPTRTDAGLVWDGVALDVTGLKRAEEDQARMTAELARVYRAQTTSQLTRGIGQELAVLLRPLLSHAELAVRAVGFADPAREDVLAVLNAADRIRTLADNIAGMGDGDEGSRLPVDVVGVVSRGLETMRGLLPSLTIDASLDGAGAMVMSTQDEAERLVTNLCAYAAEALGNQGRLRVTSSIVASELGRGFRLSFVGLPGRRIRQPVGPGQAFPLAMARAIVEGCGGWIDTAGNSENGGLIEVTLPIHDPAGGNVIDFQGGAKWQKSRT